ASPAATRPELLHKPKVANRTGAQRAPGRRGTGGNGENNGAEYHQTDGPGVDGEAEAEGVAGNGPGDDDADDARDGRGVKAEQAVFEGKLPQYAAAAGTHDLLHDGIGLSALAAGRHRSSENEE